MLQRLMGLSSTTSSSRKENIQTGYIGRMVQQLETQITSLIETSRIISVAKTRLELSRIAFNHEIATQLNLLQHEITSMQNQLRFLVETRVPERETSSPEDLEAHEGYIRSSLQSFQDLTQILEESANRPVPELALRPFEEPGLMRRLGQLHGMLQANQLVSLPREPVEMMVMDLTKEVVLRDFELQHEVLSVSAESDSLVTEICDIQLEIVKKYFRISDEYIDRSVSFIQGEELQTVDSISPHVKMFKACAITQQALLIRLIQRITFSTQGNFVDCEDLVRTVLRSGTERSSLWNEISGGNLAEEGSIPQSQDLLFQLQDFGKVCLQEDNRLQEIVSRTLENHHLQFVRKVDTLSKISEELNHSYKNHLLRISSLTIESQEDHLWERKNKFLADEQERLMAGANSMQQAMLEVARTCSLDAIARGNSSAEQERLLTGANSMRQAMFEVARTGALDAIARGNLSAFFTASDQQKELIISQVNQLAIELAKADEDAFKVFASEVAQTVRCLITGEEGLTQSVSIPALAGPSTSEGAEITGLAASSGTPTPAIAEQSEGGGGPATSQASSSSAEN